MAKTTKTTKAKTAATSKAAKRPAKPVVDAAARKALVALSDVVRAFPPQIRLGDFDARCDVFEAACDELRPKT